MNDAADRIDQSKGWLDEEERCLDLRGETLASVGIKHEEVERHSAAMGKAHL
jgi:hypothetical protein